MSLYLVRHPRPVAYAGCCYGRTELGVAPAERCRVLARCRAGALDAAIPFGSVHALEAPCAR